MDSVGHRVFFMYSLWNGWMWSLDLSLAIAQNRPIFGRNERPDGFVLPKASHFPWRDSRPAHTPLSFPVPVARREKETIWSQILPPLHMLSSTRSLEQSHGQYWAYLRCCTQTLRAGLSKPLWVHLLFYCFNDSQPACMATVGSSEAQQSFKSNEFGYLNF